MTQIYKTINPKFLKEGFDTKWVFDLLALFLLLSLSLPAQTFHNTSGGLIPASGSAAPFIINVPILNATQINGNFGLKTICIDITHPHIANLGIYLSAPDGTQIDLVDGAGGTGANFTGTCFSMSASVTIFSGFAPFSGTYYPRHNIGEMNNGQNGTGAWQLIVQDLAMGDTGHVNSWSMSFDTMAPVPASTPIGPCNQFNAQGCSCADSTQTHCWLVPDMLVGDEWFTDTIHRREFHDSITVSNSVANIGYGPMEIIGTGLWFCGDSQVSGPGLCPDGIYAKQLVKQRIYVKTQNGFFTFIDSSVGTMSFHSELGHRHLHVDNWTQNTLRIRGPEADPTKWPIIGVGIKNSMNLYDHIRCDNVFTACDYDSSVYQIGNLRNGGLGQGYNSGSANVQGISVGYADIYEYLLPFGQAIYFDSVCNGDYILMAQYDPLNRFIDMRPENNVTWFKTSLTRQTSNCCKTKFVIDTIDYAHGIFRFIDRSMAIPSVWHWTFGDGDTSSEQFPYHTFTNPGYHTITLHTQTAQGCFGVDTFSLLLPQTVGIESESSAHLDISVYPNPSTKTFILTCTGAVHQDIHLSLCNSLGQQMPFTFRSHSFTPQAQSFELNIETTGIYILHLQSGDRFYSRVLVKN